MTVTEAIPRVLRSELTLRGWTLTKLGEAMDPPVNVDQAAKRIKSAGHDLRRLFLVCDAMGADPMEVLIDAFELAEKPPRDRRPDETAAEWAQRIRLDQKGDA